MVTYKTISFFLFLFLLIFFFIQIWRGEDDSCSAVFDLIWFDLIWFDSRYHAIYLNRDAFFAVLACLHLLIYEKRAFSRECNNWLFSYCSLVCLCWVAVARSLGTLVSDELARRRLPLRCDASWRSSPSTALSADFVSRRWSHWRPLAVAAGRTCCRWVSSESCPCLLCAVFVCVDDRFRIFLIRIEFQEKIYRKMKINKRREIEERKWNKQTNKQTKIVKNNYEFFSVNENTSRNPWPPRMYWSTRSRTISK